MQPMSKITIALACALGMSTAAAQSVQRGDTGVSDAGKATQVVAQAPSAPIQTAQAGGTAGGSSAGASTAGASATVGLAPSLVLVGAAVATIAVTVHSGSTTQH